MAEFVENNIRFGWLNYAEMLEAIEEGSLDQYDICFTKDSHEQFIINKNLEPISIKSRLRIYSSVEAAIEDINISKQTYAGEILSIRDGEKFISYVVNQFNDGQYYISPICSDGQVDYNQLQNAPIKNVDGTVTSPIVLANLEDGFYKVTGHFITPVGNEVTSLVGNFILIETFIDGKRIKRIGDNNIFDYTIDIDGNITSDKYATEQFIKEQGYVTEDYVDAQMEALKLLLEEYIKQYVETTCTLLIRHIIEDELDARYADESDIQELFPTITT